MTLDDSGSKSGSVTSGNGGGRGELFSEKTKRLRRAMGDVQRGPTLIADEVCVLGDNWASYQSEADGMTFPQWLADTFGPGCHAGFWDARREAKRFGGRAFVKHLNHNGAVWLSKQCTDARQLEKAKTEILAYQRGLGEQGAVPQGLVVSESAIKRIANKIMGREKRAKACAECDRLRALLKKHGVSVE